MALLSNKPTFKTMLPDSASYIISLEIVKILGGGALKRVVVAFGVPRQKRNGPETQLPLRDSEVNGSPFEATRNGKLRGQIGSIRFGLL